MRRAWKYGVLWLAATVVTGAAAWGAVRLAGDQTAEQAVRPMSASEVAALATSTTVLPTTSSGPPAATTSTALTTPAATTSTSAPDGTVPTTTSITDARQTRGGTVVVTLQGGRLALVSATPAAGYAVEVEAASPEVVAVAFEGPGGEIRVRARVSDGRMVWEVEDDEGDEND